MTNKFTDDGEIADDEPVEVVVVVDELQVTVEIDWQLALLTFTEVEVPAIASVVYPVDDIVTPFVTVLIEM